MYIVIDSESLDNPLFLNPYKTIKVVIEYEPNSESNKYHHILFIKLEDNFNDFFSALTKTMKTGWYSFAWTKEKIIILFKNKQFSMPKNNYWLSPIYKDAVRYGLQNDIQEEFLDYKKYLDRYIVED